MSGNLIFDEQTLLDGNIFKFEQRLQSHINRYVENGMILSTYFSQRESATTVNRGTRDIEQIFGTKSPLRYNKINNLPLSGFGQSNPDNTDESQIEDINVEGDCILLPSTITPKPMDFFMLNHLKMKAIFEVTNVQYDSMKIEGYYKIHYKLFSTSDETLQNLDLQTVDSYSVDLNSIGSDVNPVIREDYFKKRIQIKQMVNSMIKSYRALFYNTKHNCFLYHNQEMGLDWFDLCGNDFISNHNLMNSEGSPNVIILHEKIKDIQKPLFYNNSIYNWLEIGAPERMLQKFYFRLNYAEGYPDSSFARLYDGDIQIMQPLSLNQVGLLSQNYSFFDDIQLNCFLNSKEEPTTSEYDKLIWKYIHKQDSLSVKDISLYTSDSLLSSIRHIDIFLYTPIIIYIIRKILRMN